MLDTLSPAVAIRWGMFTALLITIGTASFRLLVLGRLVTPAALNDALRTRLLDTHERRIALWGLVSVIALAALAVGRLLLQVAELRDPTEPWRGPAAVMLFETTWGIGWWLQVGAALICLAGFLIIRGRNRQRTASLLVGWSIVTIGALALATTPALSGHAVGSPRLTALAVAGDTLHVLGAGAWLGTLALTLATVMSRGRPTSDAAADVAAVIRAFSPVALAAAGLVVASGVLATWLHVGAIPLLWETTYGRLLLLKIALFAAVVALGAFNWRRQSSRLGSEGGVASLRASARAELAATLLVLLVTAIVVATPLPGEE